MLDNALGWIGQVFEWIGRFVPRWEIVEPTMSGVKYVRGARVVVCPAGIHWYWPVTTKWEVHQVARQADRLESQTIVTADGKVIDVGGLLVYKINNLETLVTTCYSPMSLIQDIALSAVHDVCCDMTWDELTAAQRKGTLVTRLRNEAKKQLQDYGVEIVKCMLTDLAPTKVLRVNQSHAREGSSLL